MGERLLARWATDPKTFAAVVGEGVRRHRQAAGWTQVQLAEAAGLSPNYVARLERGELGASLFVAHQLSVTLGISVVDLFEQQPRTTRRRIAG
jgi:transcriptional regulator with XRE-family HTH domain